MDMESNGFFHYRETISLIQFASAREVFLVDPLAVRDISALGEILAAPSVQKILHGCDYDLRSFDRQYGFRFRGLYDTATATQLLNPETMGLGRAIETYLGVKLKKTARLQRSDWSRRPIPPDAIEYAAGDVAHLFALQEILDARLSATGRTEWLAEECALLELIRYEPPPDPAHACFSAKGTFDLDPRALAVFRELYLLREREAERMDRPPFKVVSNDALLALARDPDQPWHTVPNANQRWLHAVAPRLKEAVRRGRSAPPLAHPSKAKRRRSPWTDPARTRWQALSALRKKEAQALNIGPAVLWPTPSLEAIALNPEILPEELRGPGGHGVRSWQRKVFGPLIPAALAGSERQP